MLYFLLQHSFKYNQGKVESFVTSMNADEIIIWIRFQNTGWIKPSILWASYWRKETSLVNFNFLFCLQYTINIVLKDRKKQNPLSWKNRFFFWKKKRNEIFLINKRKCITQSTREITTKTWFLRHFIAQNKKFTGREKSTKMFMLYCHLH